MSAQEYAFSRTELLLGKEHMKRLAESAVVVLGIGGVGSHCTEALARCNIGTLILVDNDTVSVTNINRQAVAYQSTVGKSKVSVMKQMIHQINPKAKVFTFETFLLPENTEAVFHSIQQQLGRNPDYVVDGIDTVSAKLAAAQYCTDHSIPILASMGTGNKLHPEQFQIADIYETSVCPLCRVMRKELKARNISSLKVLYSKEQPLKPSAGAEAPSPGKRAVPGSISFVPPAAGLIIAGQVIRDILKI